MSPHSPRSVPDLPGSSIRPDSGPGRGSGSIARSADLSGQDASGAGSIGHWVGHGQAGADVPAAGGGDTSEDFAGPAAGVAAGPSTAVRAARVFPSVPGYRILGELGRGGMGVVYKAVQTSLGRPVALKMILAGSAAGEQEVERFRAEAMSVGRLAHPNIVQVYEVGEFEGRPYFTLEFVDGGSLAGRVAGVPQDARWSAGIVETIARAMQAAHEGRIIHRDLKPANILMTQAGVPKVADFGLAKQLDSGSDLTGTGAMVGSPNFMSPEQAKGEGRHVGPGTDVYALGAILYFLLTGRPPLAGRSVSHTLLLVAGSEPTPPRQLVPTIPPDLETVCLKCLQKSPGKRYPTAHELAEDLRRFLTGLPVKARPIGAMERAVRWTRRHPTAAALFAVSVVAAGVTAGLAVRLAGTNGELQRQRDAVQASLDEVTIQRTAAESARRNAEELREQADEQRQIAVNAEGEAKRQAEVARTRSQEAERARVRLLRTGAVANCSAGRVGRGLAWMLSAMEGTAAAGADDERAALLLLLEGWRHEIGLVEAEWPGDHKSITAGAVSPDGKWVALIEGNALVLYDVGGRIAAGPVKADKRFLCIGFSPDGRTLAAGDKDDRIHLYRVPDLVRRCATWAHAGGGFEGEAGFVGFGAGGRVLLTGGSGDAGRAWDVEAVLAAEPDERQPAPRPIGAVMRHGHLKAPDGHWAMVRGGCVDPEGKFAITASTAGDVRKWSLPDGKPLPETARHPVGRILRTAVSPDGRILATAGDDRTVRLWSTADLRPACAPLRQQGQPFCLSFSPDGRMLLVGTKDCLAQVWDVTGPVQREREARTKPARPGPGAGSELLPPSPDLAGADAALEVAIQAGLTEAHPLGAPLPHDRGLAAVGFLPGGERLFTATQGSPGSVMLWRRPRGSPLRLLAAAPAHDSGEVIALRMFPDGRTMATAGSDTVVRTWRLVPGGDGLPHSVRTAAAPLTPPKAEADPVAVAAIGANINAPSPGPLAAFSRDGRHFAMMQFNTVLAARDRTSVIHHWVLAESRSLRGWRFRKWLDGLDISPDGATVLVVDGSVCRLFRDASMGKAWIIDEPAPVDATAFSPDGRLIATGCKDHAVRLRELPADNATGDAGEALRTMLGGAPVRTLSFSADGRRLVAGSTDGTIRIWNVADGKPVGDPILMEDAEPAVAVLSPDGTLLAAGGRDGSIRLWHAATGTAAGAATWLHAPVTAIGFSPDGRVLAVACRDRAVRMFAVPQAAPDKPMEQRAWLAAHVGLGVNSERDARLEPAARSEARRWVTDPEAPWRGR